MAKKKKLKFEIERESVRGVIGLVVSILALLATVLLIFLSVKNHGEVSKYYAVIAILTNFVAIGGFVLDLRALYVKDTHRGVPIAGLILNGITVIFYLIIYIIGF